MSKVALSQDQLQEINSFLDAELASVGEDNSVFIGSTYTKNSYNLRDNHSPPNAANQTLNTQPLQDFDRAEILSSEGVL